MDDTNSKNRWISEKETVLIDSPVMQLVRQNCRSSEDERRFDFYILRSVDWCNVIPVTAEGNIVLIRQYRIGIGRHTLEIPGGGVEASDEGDIQSAALREMTEETGYVPAPGATCRSLGWTHPNPAIQDNRCHSFVVGPVVREREQNLDPGEMIEVVEVPLSEIPARIRSGEIRHALILNAFFQLAFENESGETLILEALRRFQAVP